MAGSKRILEIDPDYGFDTNEDEELQTKRARIMEENARDVSVEKIRTIIDEQFTKEIEAKENELMKINQRLAEARCVMDRLRACAIASFYATSFTKPVDVAKGPDAGAAYHPAIQNVMRKAVTAVMSKSAPPFHQDCSENDTGNSQSETCNDTLEENTEDQQDAEDASTTMDTSVNNVEQDKSIQEKVNDKPPSATKNTAPSLGGRHRIKKTIVVGNVSKYIPPDQREGSDKSTHKWMVYVRGEKNEPRIDHFVRKVWFFLHPSYRPNDLVEVCEAPFHLTRRGWGEFPVRVQIHFCDRRNRPVDIIHQLKLDRTYTGLQTLGAETVCKVEIDESSVQLSVDEMLEVSTLSTLPEENMQLPNIKLTDFSERADLLAEKKKELKEDKTDECIAQDTDEPDTDSMDVTYSEQHQFQPVTTSCTISSNTVSPSRKGSSDQNQDDKNSQTMGEHEEKGESGELGEKENANNKEKKEEKEEEQEEEGDHPIGKKRRKRRRDSCRVSASEEDTDIEKPTVRENSEEMEVEMEADISTATPECESEISSHSESPKSDDLILLGNSSEGSDVSDTVVMMLPESDMDSANDTETSTLPSTSKSKSQKSSLATISEKIPTKTKQEPTGKSSSPKGRENSSDITGTTAVPIMKSKQPVIVVPKSTGVGSAIVRVRSASDGGGVPSESLGAVKIGSRGTQISEVKDKTSAHGSKTTDATSSTCSPGKSMNVFTSKEVLAQTSIHVKSPSDDKVAGKNPGKMGTNESSNTSKSTAASSNPSTFAVPLSSLLSTTGNQAQTLAVKKSPMVTLSPKGPYLSLKSCGIAVGKESPVKLRQKRSFSADQSLKQTISIIPASLLNTKLKSGSNQSKLVSQPVQLHIVNPPSTMKSGTKIQATTSKTHHQQQKVKLFNQQNVVILDTGSKVQASPSGSTTISLQALRAALSSGSLSMNSPVKIKTEKHPGSESSLRNIKQVGIAPQQQYVLATVVNPKGKQQLALIKPSNLSLGSTKTTISVSSGKSKISGSEAVKSQAKISAKSVKNLAVEKKPQQDAVAILNKLLPEPTYKVIGDAIQDENLTSIVDQALPLVVKRVPLVSEKRKLTDMPFCAQSEADFLEWNVGKQRAAEWQRAILVRRVLKYLQSKSKKLQACNLPSKKFIMNWCLRHGYSVFTDEYEETADEDSSQEKELPNDIQPTMSTPEEILNKLQEKLLENMKAKKPVVPEVIDVDVVTVDSPTRHRQTAKEVVIKQEADENVEIPCDDDVSQTFKDETVSLPDNVLRNVESVKEMTREIGLDMSSQHGEQVCNMILAKAMAQFVDHLLRESLAASLIRRDGENSLQRVAPEEIEVVDVMNAVKSTSVFGFLSDKNMAAGYQIPVRKEKSSSNV